MGKRAAQLDIASVTPLDDEGLTTIVTSVARTVKHVVRSAVVYSFDVVAVYSFGAYPRITHSLISLN